MDGDGDSCTEPVRIVNKGKRYRQPTFIHNFHFLSTPNPNPNPTHTLIFIFITFTHTNSNTLFCLILKCPFSLHFSSSGLEVLCGSPTFSEDYSSALLIGFALEVQSQEKKL